MTRFSHGDGDYYSWESVNWENISPEMMTTLFQSDSPIEELDLSLSTIDDAGLEQIAMGAHRLTRLYLSGANKISDSGIMSLAEHLPNLKFIEIRSVYIREPFLNWETLSVNISKEVIQHLLKRGVEVID